MNKFYVVCNSYHPNTAYTNRVFSFLRGFSELGVDTEVVFLAPDKDRSKVQDLFPHITFHYMWEKMPFSNRIINKLAEEYYGWKFSRMLKAGDVVFLTNFGNIFFRVIGKRGVKVIHEKTEHPDVYSFKGFNVARYKQEVPKVDGLFVISTALRDYFASLGVDKAKIEIVNMTVDYNRFAGLIKQPTEKYIAYCGTASNNKDGVDELIKSFAIVHQSYPEVKLYIIGETPDKEDVSGNLKLIKDLGLQDVIVFTGIISYANMPQVLKNATILALDRPDSLQAKCGFPTKLGEYLLTENPVVVTKVGDIPLFLQDGQSALLAEERNPEEFASKIIWILEHPSEAAEIGKKGAKVALLEFNYLTETKKILNMINKL
ncbi:glycosyltransferase family 4 protein [Parabacteroides distasonis]|nr:glycosyltransferase family 4 protein [Parabacteroides distasonis]